MLRITDPKWQKKMDRALRQGQNLHDLGDISNALMTGHMQSHVVGDTMAITRVQDWPQRRSVEITYVVGTLPETLILAGTIENWARDRGATLLTCIGREGWSRTPFKEQGWRQVGRLYAKDI